MKQKICLGLLFTAVTLSVNAQNINNVQLPEMLRDRTRKEMVLPTVNGYQVLKCDFHTHTVFSDGSVWPTVRIDEAWSEGLDVIALTDHLESTPKKEYVIDDKNAPHVIAKPLADKLGIILLHAGEITRAMPPGHLNALFINDANALIHADSVQGAKVAKEQGAFIMWNHPGWKAQQPDTCLWMPTHEMLYQENMMHGIEVFNEKEWYPIALDWCLEKGLAPMATSDIHGVAEYFYDYNHAPRPMTLVLATERTEESLKEAMFAKRTIALFNNMLAGRQEHVEALFKASILVKKELTPSGKECFWITNCSDIPYIVSGDISGTIKPKQTIRLALASGSYAITVENAWVGSSKKLKTYVDLK